MVLENCFEGRGGVVVEGVGGHAERERGEILYCEVSSSDRKLQPYGMRSWLMANSSVNVPVV